MKIDYIKNLRRVLVATNRCAALYGDTAAYQKARAKNIAKVLPRGRMFNQLLTREFRHSTTVVSPNNPIEIMHVGSPHISQHN